MDFSRPEGGFKLFATDLDWTLLQADRTLTDSDAAAVRGVYESGIQVALASGRGAPSMRHYRDQIGIPAFLVCANGSQVVTPDDEIIRIETVPISAVKTVVTYADEFEVHLNAYTPTELLFLHDTEWGREYLKRVKYYLPRFANAAEFEEAHILKLMLIAEPDRKKKLAEALTPLVEHEVHATESEPEYLEYLSNKANKGLGLKSVAERLGISAHQIAAIGDYQNDLEMLEYAGFSGAVANALPEVKAVADVTVSAHDQGGVASFIDSYVLNKRK